MPTTTASTVTTGELRGLIRAELPELIEVRHDLHRHPELGYQEQRTSALVRRELERAGVEFAGSLAGGTGVLAHLPGAAEGAVGLRADMDALPIAEETGLPYASTRAGTMHACGHDGHTTILIGAARVLARLSRDHPLPHPLTLVFQPAEEGGAGGRRMIEDGCLDGSVFAPPVRRMFGLHGWPRLPLGLIGTRPGPLLAASDTFEIAVRGTGSHAAFPHASRDPVVTACAIVQALQTIVSRNTDPLDAIVVSATQIAGGTATNIIPGAVRLAGTVRTLREETRRLAVERLKAIAEGVGLAHRCRAEVRYTVGYPVTTNDAGAAQIVREAAEGALGSERFVELSQPVMGGEDFSFYGQRVPACFFVLGLIPPGAESMPDLHQPTFDFNDEAIETGIEMFCRLAGV